MVGLFFVLMRTLEVFSFCLVITMLVLKRRLLPHLLCYPPPKFPLTLSSSASPRHSSSKLGSALGSQSVLWGGLMFRLCEDMRDRLHSNPRQVKLANIFGCLNLVSELRITKPTYWGGAWLQLYLGLLSFCCFICYTYIYYKGWLSRVVSP